MDTQLAPLQVLMTYPRHNYTLSSVLESRAVVKGGAEFLVYGDCAWTYEQVLSMARRAATLFARRGVACGDRVAVWSRNHPAVVVAWLGLARLGAVMVPMNPDVRAEDAAYVLDNAGVCGVIASPELMEPAVRACEALRVRPWFLPIEGNASAESLLVALAQERGDVPPEAPGADQATCVLIYSSGTTGPPKGVMHNQRTVVMAGEGFVQRMHLQPDERMMCVLPLFHINALFYSLCGALAAGAALMLIERFSASTFWVEARRHRVTEVNMIAAMTSILVRRSRSEFDAGHSISKIYGAPLDAPTIRVFREEFRVPHMIEGYGMSEIPGVLNVPWDGPERPGSMGRPSTHPSPDVRLAEVAVMGDDGVRLPSGTVGELVVRTPLLMQGYFGDPEKTAQSQRDGWFLTGDLVREDGEGFFWFVARKKDIIRRRGENVSGAEIDRVVAAHPEVEAAAAIGVPSPLGEEEILIAMVPKAGSTLDAAQFRQWCEDRLAAWKVPRYLAVLDTLPYTPTHRIAKHKLREMGLLSRAVDMQGSDG